MTFRREKINIINEALKHRIISLLNLNIFYIEQQNDWTDENNRLIMKYFYKDELHLEKPGNQKLNKKVLEALKKRQYLLHSITNNSKINTISNNFLCNKEQFPLINKEVHHLAKQNSPEYQHKSYASCVKNNNNNIITKRNLKPIYLNSLSTSRKGEKTIHTTKSSTCQQKGYENNNAKYNKININRKRTTQTLKKRRKTTPTNVIIDECILKMPRIIDDHKHEDQYTPRKKDEIRSRAKKRKPSIISSTTAHPSQIVEAPIWENETNNSEKTYICLSILYIFKFLLLFGTIFPFITARYLFSFLKIIVLARFKKLNVILIIYTLFCYFILEILIYL